MPGIFIKRENLDTDMYIHVKTDDWCDAFIAKKHQTLPLNHRKLGRGMEKTPYRFQSEHGPRYLDFGLLASITVR